MKLKNSIFLILILCILVSCRDESYKSNNSNGLPSPPTSIPTPIPSPTSDSLEDYPSPTSDSLEDYPSPTSAPFTRIDYFIENNMRLGSIAFETPDKMEVEKTREIELWLNASIPHKELQEALKKEKFPIGKEEYPISSYKIKLSDKMKAVLSGDNFEVKPILPETQVVGLSTTSKWRWSVKPKKTGKQKLRLIITALLFIDDSDHEVPIEVFNRIIIVEIGIFDRISTFFEKNWQFLLGTISLPIFLWYVARQRTKKNQKE